MPPCVIAWSAALQVILDAADDVGPSDSFPEMIGQLLAAISTLVCGDRASWVQLSRLSTPPIVTVNDPMKAPPADTATIHHLRLNLSHRSGEAMVIVVDRWTAPPFDEADRLILRLLRPHLDLAFRRFASPAPRLTARETEVLLQVRDGLGNAEIAKQLGVAQATVVKHLEHVFRRSGAHSRTEAVRIYESALS